MRRISLLCLLMVLAFFGKSQPVAWEKGIGDRNICEQVQVMTDKSGHLTIEQVASPGYSNKFATSGQSTLHFGFTDRVCWIRFDLINNSSDSLLLRLEQAFLTSVLLYYQDEKQHWQVIKSGYALPLGQKPVVDHFQVFPLPGQQHTLYLRLNPLIHAIPIRLLERNYWSVKASREKMTYGIYAGIMLFAVIINLFLFFGLEKVYFLNYAVLIFFYLLTSALVLEGYAVYFFPTIDLMFWYKLVPILDMCALLFYSISFFELRKTHPGLYRFTRGAALFCCCYLLLSFWLPLLLTLLVNQIFALLVFVLASTIGIRVGKQGNRLGYLFSIFYGLWFLLILTEAIYIQTGYPVHLTAVSYVSTASFIEAFLLAFLQAKRFEWERKEDHLKQFQMSTQIERMEENYQREMLNNKLEIQEQTFNSISEEIHDNVGQLLSLAKIQVNIMEQKELKDGVILQELKENLSTAMSDLRHIAKSLSSQYVTNNSLEETVRHQVQRINRLGVLSITLQSSGTEKTIGNSQKLVLLRIIQESLQNILKHANATSVEIVFSYDPQALQISIADNGKGFDPQALNKQAGGLGLQNMTSRAALIGATATIETKLQQGTTIQISTAYA